MTRVTATWVERPGRELHRIESLEIVRSFAAMQAEPRLLAACAVLAEIVQATAREDQGDPDTFRLVGALLDALERGVDPWAVVRYAEYWVLKLHGVLPDLDACAACGEPFGPGEARAAAPGVGLLCRRCPKPPASVALRAVEIEALAAFERTPPARLNLAHDAVRPKGGLELLLRGALEAFVERKLRSYRHLRALDPRGAPPS